MDYRCEDREKFGELRCNIGWLVTLHNFWLALKDNHGHPPNKKKKKKEPFSHEIHLNHRFQAGIWNFQTLNQVVESQLFTSSWYRCHQLSSDINYIQMSTFYSSSTPVSLMRTVGVWQLTLPLNSRTPENDHLHVYSLSLSFLVIWLPTRVRTDKITGDDATSPRRLSAQQIVLRHTKQSYFFMKYRQNRTQISSHSRAHHATVAATTLLHHTDHSAFLYTVKATNFGPHGNFGPLFQKGLLLLKRILQKNEENKSCRNSLDVQIRFCSFLVHDSSKEATELAREGPKFPWGPKLEALTVASNSCNVYMMTMRHLSYSRFPPAMNFMMKKGVYLWSCLACETRWMEVVPGTNSHPQTEHPLISKNCSTPTLHSNVVSLEKQRTKITNNEKTQQSKKGRWLPDC